MARLIDDLCAYLADNKHRFSTRSRIAEAIHYALVHWGGLTRILHDGRMELDSNIVERSIHPVALTKRNSLFAGTGQGAGHWAVASLLETSRLNGTDPLKWLASTLNRLAQGSENHVGGLTP